MDFLGAHAPRVWPATPSPLTSASEFSEGRGRLAGASAHPPSLFSTFFLRKLEPMLKSPPVRHGETVFGRAALPRRPNPGRRVGTTQRGTTRCAASSALPGRRRILSCSGRNTPAHFARKFSLNFSYFHLISVNFSSRPLFPGAKSSRYSRPFHMIGTYLRRRFLWQGGHDCAVNSQCLT
jgi:hypothetical protein